jgi:hypothetical protein
LFPTSAKIGKTKDSTKVLEFFRYKTGTTLDAAIATGVLRNCITWYVSIFEKMGVLICVYKRKDVHTGYMAKYYTADPERIQREPRELSFIKKEEL